MPAGMTDEVQDTKLRGDRLGAFDAASEDQQGSGMSLDAWRSRQEDAELAMIPSCVTSISKAFGLRCGRRGVGESPFSFSRSVCRREV